MTRIIRRTISPAPEMVSLRDIVDRMFQNAVVSPSQWLGAVDGGNLDAPALDVIENDDGFVVKAALPGWKPEQVEVSIENGVLMLKGDASGEQTSEDEKNRYHRKEIRRASFQRMLALPTEVNPDKADAAFENGILTLSVPKAEMVKPKTIKIAVK